MTRLLARRTLTCAQTEERLERELRGGRARGERARGERSTHHDQLAFRVSLHGDEALELRERDHVVHNLVAGAVAPPDLREVLWPTERASIWHPHVSLDFRDTPERGPRHLSPESLGRSIPTSVASVSHVTRPIGRAVASASVTCVTPSRPLAEPERSSEPALLRPLWSLDPPAALAHGAEHERVRP